MSAVGFMWKLISKITVVAVTGLLMLLTCEIATRLFARVPVDVSQRDPLIGRRFESNLAQHIYSYEINAPVFLRTNQLGFRGKDVSVDKPDNVCSIAVLGDSYTAAMALTDEQTFCGQLEQLLNSRHHSSKKWEVLNFGIFGSGTGQELALYRNLVKDLHPDIVIVAFGNATDLRDNSRELSTNPIIQFQVDGDGRLQQIPQSAERIQVSNMLNRFSHFYTWQKMKSKTVKQLFQKQADLDRGRNLIYARQEPAAYRRAWDITAALLRAFRDECQENGSRFMVAAIPSAYQIYPDYFAELTGENESAAELDPMHPDRRLSEICDDSAIPFLSLTPVFRERAPSGSYLVEAEQLFIGGKAHLNVKGSQVVAAELSAWVSETRLAADPVQRY